MIIGPPPKFHEIQDILRAAGQPIYGRNDDDHSEASQF
jgi:hypothetical protein